MTFKPVPCKTRWEGLLVTSWIVLLDCLLAVWLLRRPVDWLSFLLMVLILASIPVALHLAYRTWGAFNLEYWVNRDAVTVRWAGIRQVIPLARIKRIIKGGGSELSKPGMANWPAPYVRQSTALGMLDVRRYATRPLAECLLLETDQGVFALSPANPAAFLETVQHHYSLGPAHDLPVMESRPMPCGAQLLQDGVALILLSIGLLGVLVLFGALMIPYPNLPDALTFHYNAAGIPDSVRTKNSLFLLPMIGALAYVVNGVWGGWMACRRQQLGAYLLWGGAITVQVFTFFALLSLIP